MATQPGTKTVRWRFVKSSNVNHIGWDDENNMYVVYKDGDHLYKYKGVSRQRAVAAVHAQSVGQYINKKIKPNFPVTRLL